jgi:inward rectifier potassium channel
MKVRDAAFEARKMGAVRYELSDPYHLAVTVSWPVFIGGALALLAIINGFFASLYLLEPGAVQNLPAHSVAMAFFFSLETLATVGYGEMAPAGLYGHAVAAGEIVCGMAFTAILTGLLFVRFSRPKARIVFADQAVITQHNGHATLMIRIANGRLTLLSNARAKLSMLLGETSAEGQFFRYSHDLELTRKDIPVFALAWTLMHKLDDKSPLAGMSAEDFVKRDVRMFLSIQAYDNAIGADVQAARDYRNDRILFGRRYADAVIVGEDGHSTADLARISLLEPEGSAAAPKPETAPTD